MGAAACESDGMGKRIRDQILRKTEVDRLLPLINSTCQHHVQQARLADQISHADRRPATGEQASLTFGQCEVGAWICHANMGGRCQFQPATYDCARKRGDDRHAAVFHLGEGPVPAQA